MRCAISANAVLLMKITDISNNFKKCLIILKAYANIYRLHFGIMP